MVWTMARSPCPAHKIQMYTLEDSQKSNLYSWKPSKIKFPVKYLGHITSSYHSPTLKHYIAMAMVEGGNDLIGKKLYVTQNKSSENISVEIVKPVFLDPENKRLLSWKKYSQ